MPARGFCDACFTETTDWIEVSPHGTLETFTILTTSFPGLPEPPLVVGYVRLDGATSAVLNFVEGIDLADPDQAGPALLRQPRVTARFKDSCEGRITDFTFTLDEPSVTADLAIAGVGQTAYRRRHEGSTPELVHTAVRAALDHAGLTPPRHRHRGGRVRPGRARRGELPGQAVPARGRRGRQVEPADQHRRHHRDRRRLRGHGPARGRARRRRAGRRGRADGPGAQRARPCSTRSSTPSTNATPACPRCRWARCGPPG